MNVVAIVRNPLALGVGNYKEVDDWLHELKSRGC